MGRVSIDVHRGALFRVYQATLDDGRVVTLKVPADHGTSAGDVLYGAFANLIFTRLFSIDPSVSDAQQALCMALLDLTANSRAELASLAHAAVS